MFKRRWVIWGMLAVFLTADVLLLSVITAPPAPISLDSARIPTVEYLEQNPQPTPDFIAEYSTDEASCLSMESSISVGINQRPFARVGIAADALSQHLFENHDVKVDGVSVESDAAQFTTLMCEGGELGDTANSKCFGGTMNVCIDVSLAKTGLHLAEITVTDLEGIPHHYSWAFRVD